MSRTVLELRRLAAARGAGRPARPARPAERCDLCGSELPADHRHLLQLVERQIVCTCESCFALRAGDAEYRPAGRRLLRLGAFRLAEEAWAGFRIPIGLAFLFRSSATDRVVAVYPSAAGATESELDLDAWDELVAANPVLGTLEPDAEALVVNRLAEPHRFLIAPIDRCYALGGLVRLRWEGIAGGTRLGEAIEGFFAELEAEAEPA